MHTRKDYKNNQRIRLIQIQLIYRLQMTGITQIEAFMLNFFWSM